MVISDFIKKEDCHMMLYGAMNYPIKPVLNELEEIAQLGDRPIRL
jgi:hypothetical protein